jgi:hypothetical protein
MQQKREFWSRTSPRFIRKFHYWPSLSLVLGSHHRNIQKDAYSNIGSCLCPSVSLFQFWEHRTWFLVTLMIGSVILLDCLRLCYTVRLPHSFVII